MICAYCGLPVTVLGGLLTISLADWKNRSMQRGDGQLARSSCAASPDGQHHEEQLAASPASPATQLEAWIEKAPRRDLQRILRDITGISAEAFVLAYQLHDIPPQPKNTTPHDCPDCGAKAGNPCTYLSWSIHRVGGRGEYVDSIPGQPMQMIHHNRPK